MDYKIPPLTKRLKNIIWHSFDVPWYWEQLKSELREIGLGQE